jgi:PHD/YefM family antitoxin component YafN of YafNO toxin-antitoxin module
MKLVSSRDFNQDVTAAKRAARLEPVFVTDRGRPTHVLMSIDAFRQITGQTEAIIDLLAMPELADADLVEGHSDDLWGRHEVRG